MDQQRKRVLLDVDGVLADFVGPALSLVEEATGRKYTREDVTAFDFAASLGLSLAEAALVKKAISYRANWWSTLPVIDGAIDGVERLRSVSDVYVLTSPWNSCPTWLHEREGWLKKHFGIPHSHILVGSAKHLVAGDMLVDDKTETLREWSRLHGHLGGRAVQWQTPHNRADEWSGLSTQSWEQLAAWVSSPHDRFDVSEGGEA